MRTGKAQALNNSLAASLDMAKRLKKQAAQLPSSVSGSRIPQDDLPPGWVRKESRSKRGAFYYAHPATGRTQVEHPGGSHAAFRASASSSSRASGASITASSSVGRVSDRHLAHSSAGLALERRPSSSSASTALERRDSEQSHARNATQVQPAPASAALVVDDSNVVEDVEEATSEKEIDPEEERRKQEAQLKVQEEAKKAQEEAKKIQEEARRKRAEEQERKQQEEDEAEEAMQQELQRKAMERRARQMAAKAVQMKEMEEEGVKPKKEKKKEKRKRKRSSSSSEDQVTLEDIQKWKEEEDRKEREAVEAEIRKKEEAEAEARRQREEEERRRLEEVAEKARVEAEIEEAARRVRQEQEQKRQDVELEKRRAERGESKQRERETSEERHARKREEELDEWRKQAARVQEKRREKEEEERRWKSQDDIEAMLEMALDPEVAEKLKREEEEARQREEQKQRERQEEEERRLRLQEEEEERSRRRRREEEEERRRREEDMYRREQQGWHRKEDWQPRHAQDWQRTDAQDWQREEQAWRPRDEQAWGWQAGNDWNRKGEECWNSDGGVALEPDMKRQRFGEESGAPSMRNPPPPPPPPARSAPPSTPASPAATPAPAQATGVVLWYNGRQQRGMIKADQDGKMLPIPPKGAPNLGMAPPVPGGLMHGTRVTYTPTFLPSTGLACYDVRPLEGQVGLSCGGDSQAGARQQNEDRTAAVDLPDGLGHMVGILDGHRGTNCSDFLSQRLPQAVVTSTRERFRHLLASGRSVDSLTADEEVQAIREGMMAGFEACDRDFLTAAKANCWGDGSSALLALLVHGFQAKESYNGQAATGTVPHAPGGVAKCLVAWSGTSRMLLLRGRQGYPCTRDHVCSQHEEYCRLQAQGALLVQDPKGVWWMGRSDRWDLARQRQQGYEETGPKSFSAASRGFGDLQLKDASPNFYGDRTSGPVLRVMPEVYVVDLTPDDWAIVLAGRGVFSVLSDQEVADVCMQELGTMEKGPVEAARAVTARAKQRGATDNLTCIVMRLGWSKPPTQMSLTEILGARRA